MLCNQGTQSLRCTVKPAQKALSQNLMSYYSSIKENCTFTSFTLQYTSKVISYWTDHTVTSYLQRIPRVCSIVRQCLRSIVEENWKRFEIEMSFGQTEWILLCSSIFYATCTGPGNNTCTWFGEVCSCCCLSLEPQLACNILATTYK